MNRYINVNLGNPEDIEKFDGCVSAITITDPETGKILVRSGETLTTERMVHIYIYHGADYVTVLAPKN